LREEARLRLHSSWSVPFTLRLIFIVFILCLYAPKAQQLKDGRGVLVETCVECFRATSGFLTGTKLYLFLYGVPKLECEIRLRTYCSPKQSKPADEVVAKAKEMLESKRQGGTRYGFFFNNCEDFATLCKTGTAFCTQSELLFGRVGYPILKQLVQSS
jgi:hypothetical protein